VRGLFADYGGCLFPAFVQGRVANRVITLGSAATLTRSGNKTLWLSCIERGDVLWCVAGCGFMGFAKRAFRKFPGVGRHSLLKLRSPLRDNGENDLDSREIAQNVGRLGNLLAQYGHAFALALTELVRSIFDLCAET
jgi:hypothetical protein